MPDVRLSRLDLNSAGALRREPPRLVGQRQPDYEASFDFRTVFYDCFSSVDGRRLICIGPPLANLARAVLPAILRAFKKSMFSRAEIRRLDRVCQLAFRPGSANAVLSGDLFEQRALAPQPNHCDWFRGRRVLTAISKDNHLDWIRDWAEFYVRWHGCDAVLLYDNGSTQYESAKVRDVLRAIPGVDLAVVVDWRFPFGPSGGGSAARSRTGPNGEQLAIWDSDFCQYGFLQHAHQRFLLSAAAVLNVDIDELVITAERELIFDLVQQSRTGYVNFSGIWIVNAAINDPGEARRHRQLYLSQCARAAANGAEVGGGAIAMHAAAAVVRALDRGPDVRFRGVVEGAAPALFRHYDQLEEPALGAQSGRGRRTRSIKNWSDGSKRRAVRPAKPCGTPVDVARHFFGTALRSPASRAVPWRHKIAGAGHLSAVPRRPRSRAETVVASRGSSCVFITTATPT